MITATPEALPMSRRLAAVLAVAAVAIPAAAADLTVQNVKLGKSLYGPPVAADQLQGTVVFVEEWGIH
jgi:hypothetical protein